ncbi:MAG: hypothetical protein RL662_416 [Bacteroidota bacterium]|jgi:TonB-linked SusC/RagA family outer membrane protein
MKEKRTQILKQWCLLLCLLLVGISANAQRFIKGTITDVKGEPIIGAIVQQKGTAEGIVSDIDGNYSLKLSEGAKDTVSFSMISYRTELRIISPQTLVLDIVLRDDAKLLEEIVVVGYSTRKIEDVTGAVTNIKADQTNIGGASTSVDQMLSGRVSGVQFKQTSSQPGGGGKTIIRGRNSLFLKTDPLYVIDGFIINAPESPSAGNIQFSSPSRDPLNSINPNDIESIAVLKDAAATAIYGAQGSNGVIIITTKRGKQGQMKVGYDGYASLQTVSKRLDVLNAQDYMKLYNDLGQTTYTDEQIKNGKTTDWIDETTTDGFIQNHNVNLSGGSETLRYYFSLGAFSQKGILKNTGMDRYTGRTNVEYKKDKFTFNSNIFASYIKDNNQPTNGGTRESIISGAMAFAPNVPVRDTNGKYASDPNSNFNVNPVSLLDIKDNLFTDKLNFSVGAAYQLLPFLKAEVKGTYDTQNMNRKLYVPTTTAYNGSFSHRGTALQASYRSTGATFNGLLHYDQTFDEVHHLTGLVGYELYERNNNYFNAFNSGFGTDVTGADNLVGGNSPLVNSNRDRRKDLSTFGRLDYSYADKYLLTMTLRRDGASVFGKNNKFAYFPGISAGWKLDKEEFLQDATAIDMLKVRLGYGVSGNSGIAPYQSLRKYDINTNSILGGNAVIGAFLPEFKDNPDLKWESTSQLNLGVDYSFKGRFSGGLDFFVKSTKDMLVQLDLLPETGYKRQWSNAASMRVWGVEYSLNSTNISTKDFDWNTTFSFSWLDNKITDYNVDNASTINALNAMGIIKGERTNSYYTYITNGIDKTSGSFSFEKDKDSNAVRQIVGTPDPRFILGLGNTLRYKELSLDFFFSGNFGNKMYNQMRAMFAVPRTDHKTNYLQEAQGYWHAIQRPDATLPANRANNEGNYLYNNYWIEDAWFIRLQNLTLSYDLSKASFLKPYLSKARVYLQGQNLFLITDYSGLDPEQSNGSFIGQSSDIPAAFLPGSVDMNAYPSARTFTVGINISF